MKLPLDNSDVRAVIAAYPFAYCCCDRQGYYITSEKQVVGKGKKPAKAWKDAAKRLQKEKGPMTARP